MSEIMREGTSRFVESTPRCLEHNNMAPDPPYDGAPRTCERASPPGNSFSHNMQDINSIFRALSCGAVVWVVGGVPGAPGVRLEPPQHPGPPPDRPRTAPAASGAAWPVMGGQCTHCDILQTAPVYLCRWPGAPPGGALAAGEASTYVHHPGQASHNRHHGYTHPSPPPTAI